MPTRRRIDHSSPQRRTQKFEFDRSPYNPYPCQRCRIKYFDAGKIERLVKGRLITKNLLLLQARHRKDALRYVPVFQREFYDCEALHQASAVSTKAKSSRRNLSRHDQPVSLLFCEPSKGVVKHCVLRFFTRRGLKNLFKSRTQRECLQHRSIRTATRILCKNSFRRQIYYDW